MSGRRLRVSVAGSRGIAHPLSYREFLYSTRMASAQTARAGRPKRDKVNVVRTRLWFHMLKLRSGLPSAYAIEVTLEPSLVTRRVGGVIRPRKYDSYKNGKRVPSRIAGHGYSVDIAEASYPGTAAYFDSPIWPALRRETLEPHWIELQLSRMSPRLTAVLFKSVSASAQERPRLKHFDACSVDQLVDQCSFEALAALVLLTCLSEAIASTELRSVCLGGCRCICMQLKSSEIAMFVGDLLTLVEIAFPEWVFVTPLERAEMLLLSCDVHVNHASKRKT